MMFSGMLSCICGFTVQKEHIHAGSLYKRAYTYACTFTRGKVRMDEKLRKLR